MEKQMCSEFRETEEHHEHVENLQESGKRRVALAMTVSTACFFHLYDLGFDSNPLS